MTTFQWVLSGVCLVVALILVLDIVRDRQVGNPGFFGLLAVELGLVVQLVWGVANIAGGHEGVSVATYLAYLVGALLILPVGYVWSLAEKSRSGTGVLLVAVLVVPPLCLRVHDIWSAHA